MAVDEVGATHAPSFTAFSNEAMVLRSMLLDANEKIMNDGSPRVRVTNPANSNFKRNHLALRYDVDEYNSSLGNIIITYHWCYYAVPQARRREMRGCALQEAPRG